MVAHVAAGVGDIRASPRVVVNEGHRCAAAHSGHALRTGQHGGHEWAKGPGCRRLQSVTYIAAIVGETPNLEVVLRGPRLSTAGRRLGDWSWTNSG